MRCWDEGREAHREARGSVTGLGVESTTGSGAPAAPQNAATGGTSGGGLQLAWVGIPLIMLVLVVDRGVSIIDEIKQCTKQFIAHKDVALATSYCSVRGVGFVASIGPQNARPQGSLRLYTRSIELWGVNKSWVLTGGRHI
ncbi:hypothetical protein Vretifemale_7527 [Volvox reticuliferus]|nr:hypothetical protein Vretifemale_7527 [Volvox reticuliferus]